MNEDVDLSTTPLEEQVAVLMEDLPFPIKNFLQSPERDEISLQLTKKYGLHADDAGTFERAYIYMLLGIFTPDEFVQELRESDLDEATVRGLAADINEQVFKKLRAEERGMASSPAAPKIAPTQVEGVTTPANLPGQDTLPQRTAPKLAGGLATFNPPLQPPPAAVIPPQNPPRGLTNPAAVPENHSEVSPVYNQQDAPKPEYPHTRTMAGDMELAAQGTKSQAPPPPPAYVPPPTVSPATPPQVQPAPAWQPPPTAPVRPTPIDRPSTFKTPITKEYGNDPYREPIE